MDLRKGWKIRRNLDIKERELLIILCMSVGLRLYNSSGFDVHRWETASYHPTLGLCGFSNSLGLWHQELPIVTYKEVIDELKRMIQNET